MGGKGWHIHQSSWLQSCLRKMLTEHHVTVIKAEENTSEIPGMKDVSGAVVTEITVSHRKQEQW